MKQHGQSELVAELVQEFQDLRLDGDVKRGSRLVGNQQLRPIDDRHGNHDPLPHASRKLVGIAAGALLRVGDGDVAESLHAAIPSLGLRHVVVGQHCFGDLVAHAHDRIERGHGFLEDHGDA